MDFLQRIGGRKFLMTLIVIGSAMVLEMYGKGLSTNMAGFLAAVLGTFSAVNHMSTAKFLDSKPSSQNKDIQSQLDTISQQLESAKDPETVAKLVSVLTELQSKLHNLEIVSGQVGTGVINLGNQVSVLTKRLSNQP